MARYTFKCGICGQEKEVEESMVIGPPEKLDCFCGAEMKRVYSAARVEAGGNAFEVLTDWMTENYWRARQGRERFSLNDVNRPLGNRPGNNWNREHAERRDPLRARRAQRSQEGVKSNE